LETLHFLEEAPSVFSQPPSLSDGVKKTSTELHETKLRSIIEYLDKVDNAEDGRTKDLSRDQVFREQGCEADCKDGTSFTK